MGGVSTLAVSLPLILLFSFIICFFDASLALARRLRILSFCVTALDCNVDRITDRVRLCAVLSDMCGFIDCPFSQHAEHVRVETQQAGSYKSFQLLRRLQLVVMSLLP